MTNYHTLNGELLGETGPGGRRFYGKDALGSVVATYDQNGTLENTYMRRSAPRRGRCLSALILLATCAACTRVPTDERVSAELRRTPSEQQSRVEGFVTEDSAVLVMAVGRETFVVELIVSPYPAGSTVPTAWRFFYGPDEEDPYGTSQGDQVLERVRMSFRGRSNEWKLSDTILFNQVSIFHHASIETLSSRGPSSRLNAFFGSAAGEDGSVAISFRCADGEASHNSAIVFKGDEMLGVYRDHLSDFTDMPVIARRALTEFKAFPTPIMSILERKRQEVEAQVRSIDNSP